MAEKRVIEYEAASELANDDWLLIDGVTEGTRKARPSVVTAELGAQVTNLASTVGGLTQVTMGHEQSFAPSYDESASYDVGDLVMQYHGLYKCTAATTGTWDAGKWARTEVSEQLEESGKIDDVQVNGVSVVTDKVASIDLTGMQADIDSKQADTKIGGTSILDENKVLNMDNFISKASIPSGAISTFGNAMALPMPSLNVGIEAVQSGTGDPSPTNVRTITGFSAVNVVDTGINIWDEEWVIGTISTSTGEYSTSGDRVCSKNYIRVEPNKSYYKQNFAWQFYYDEYKNFISATSIADGVFTTPNNAHYMKFYTSSAYGQTYNNDISINYPSTDTDYHAYNGQTYTTQLKDGQGNPMTCYGGQLVNENGVQSLTNNEFSFYLHELNWTQNPNLTDTYNGYATLLNKRKGQMDWDDSTCYCEAYKGNTSAGISNGQIALANSVTSGEIGRRIYVRDARFISDVQGFIDEITNNPVKCALPLATPETIPQDNLAIASQSGINNIWADSGDIQSGQYFTNSVPSNVYSTEEKAVGVDVDGKTRYQKTYLNLGSVSSYTFSDLTNVSTMFVVSEGSKLNGGLPFPYIHPDSDNVVGYFFDLSGTNPKIEIRKGSGSSSATLDMLTIQYTK